MFQTGTAQRSMHHPDPVLHLIVPAPYTKTGWETFCGGGAARDENTVTHRRCRKCVALARQDLIDQGVAPDESSDLDWYLQRSVAKVAS